MSQRYKTTAELQSRVVRISLGDYALLVEISRRAGVTMAEALHLAIEQRYPETKISPAQIPMPAFRVRAYSTMAVNGSKPVAFSIKPKGGVICD